MCICVIFNIDTPQKHTHTRILKQALSFCIQKVQNVSKSLTHVVNYAALLFTPIFFPSFFIFFFAISNKIIIIIITIVTDFIPCLYIHTWVEVWVCVQVPTLDNTIQRPSVYNKKSCNERRKNVTKEKKKEKMV